jgi:chemotaxis protein histidine kinase CheA
VRIHFSDDGRGLPLEQLRSKAGKLNSPDQVVAEAIFRLRRSRRVSEVSGRGVGMDVVRVTCYLRELGGDVAIEFTRDARARASPARAALPSAAAPFPNT